MRREIAKTYQTINPDEILYLADAGEGPYAVEQSILTQDDHVIVPKPNYQSAETIPLAACEVTGVQVRMYAYKGDGWHLDIDDIRAAIRLNTKLVSLNFPHNPTGYLMRVTEALCSM
ncbi:aminotransferase class I/II-fold pyridoxal phosphate-dependent enzyme [Photobacterium sp. OFAV2-7]|uniref:aminotransferase class I/II-fold pyridoxal phosphate-dependent enzyme n=1 Tax=Photobacterium sp. OFAV2-7 TaxID=2917748 RepID=UPI001EF70FA8|nr:aminotransferase class I/II-fold pyridoxal phosphate-dependent enzyme [Photobacterium sp. OFAV2-7]MCG7588180.1 aminotransferase class I/II-fold pyridoxal phosphate-dependent enzyme [Photobacterium sp. OFAV2-7]